MNLLKASDIKDSGITIITNDNRALYGLPELTQPVLNEMCNELLAVFKKYDFTVDMMLENEHAMRMQGHIMFNKMFKAMDAYCTNNDLW